MKKILITLMALLLVSSVAFASPLMDYSAGKGEIDLTARDTQLSMSGLLSKDFNQKYNFDGSLTVGLGGNFAAQYRYFNPQSANSNLGFGSNRTFQLNTSEFNVLYKVDKNISAFAGYVNSKGQLNTPFGSVSSSTRNLWQIGALGTTQIANKTTLWGSAAAGKDLTDFEVGIGYEFSPGWELNVNYRDLKISNYSVNNFPCTFDGTAKGFGVGISYKF